MCGLVGYVNYTKDISNYKHIIEDMNKSSTKIISDKDEYFLDKHINLVQSAQFSYDNNTYTIAFNR